MMTHLSVFDHSEGICDSCGDHTDRSRAVKGGEHCRECAQEIEGDTREAVENILKGQMGKQARMRQDRGGRHVA